MVTKGPVREDDFATRGIRAEEGKEIDAVVGLADELKGSGDLVIVFGDSVRGESLRRLVAFAAGLGIAVKYVCLVDYANSRGAFDMGLIPDQGGMTIPEMLAAPDLAALWVVGANPLKNAALASGGAFVVVQDMFLTETAQRADVVLPASSAYEKNGTVTNTCGEVQRLKKALNVMGTKSDLDIFGLLARAMRLDLGPAQPDKVFEEIRANVRGYDVPVPVLATGGAALTHPVNGHVPHAAASASLVRSSRDTLFTSGTLGRYSQILSKVMEAPGGLYRK